MNSLPFMPVHKLAEMIVSKLVSSQEVLEEQIRHIKKHNPRRNVIVTMDEEAARKRVKKRTKPLPKMINGDLSIEYGLP